MEPNKYWSDYYTRFNNMEYFQNTNPTTNNYHASAYMQPLQTNGDGVNSTSYWSQNYYTNWDCAPTTSTATASNNGAGVVHNYGYGYHHPWPQLIYPPTPLQTLTPHSTPVQEIQQESKEAMLKSEANTIGLNLSKNKPTSLFKKSAKCTCPLCSLPQDESTKGQPRRHGCLDNVFKNY